jgi:hypothetical protein
LSGHADSLGFAIDSAEQIDRKVDVHPPDFAARPLALEKSR